MTEFRKYTVSAVAIKQGEAMGLFGDVAGYLSRLARLSAPYRHARANYRYEGFLFDIRDGEVAAVYKDVGETDEAVPAQEAIDETATVGCPDCDNDGGWCVTCGGTGHVTAGERRKITV